MWPTQPGIGMSLLRAGIIRRFRLLFHKALSVTPLDVTTSSLFRLQGFSSERLLKYYLPGRGDSK
jgi:hypothetical protein